jgi:hypothetical protein
MFIPDPDPDFLPIPYPGFGSATLVLDTETELWAAYLRPPVLHFTSITTVSAAPYRRVADPDPHGSAPN